MESSEQVRNSQLNRNSHLSLTSEKRNSIVNGLIRSDHLSETLTNMSSSRTNPSPNPTGVLNNCNYRIKRFKRIKYIITIIFLTFIFAFLFLITIQFGTTLFKHNNYFNYTFIIINNQTKFDEEQINSYFGCVWFFNLLLFIICLFVHLFIYRQHSQSNRDTAAFLREFGRIFDNVNCSSTNPLVDYLIKTCLLCILWYLCCYLMFRSMSILISSEIIILYSITITLREILAWIFLHEQFIGNKIIAHIIGLSSLLFLAHNNGFRFNKFLLGLTMLTSSVIIKTIFDVVVDGFIKDLTNCKFRIVMINVCLCGTCLLWPFVLLFHVTTIETININQFYSFTFLITLICALTYNILIISIPIKYKHISNLASIIILIPSISLINYYYFNVKYSTLYLSSIISSFVSVILSIIPKQCFQSGEKKKMKQILGLNNKDSNRNNIKTINRTSSPFHQIRTERSIRNTFLYNHIKT